MFKSSAFLVITAALAVGVPARAAIPAAPEGLVYAPATVAPMSVTVRERLLPQEAVLLRRLIREGRAMIIDGQPVFGIKDSGGDKFLPGKIASGLAYLIVQTPASDPARAEYLQGFRTLSRLTLDDTNDTWGIYYYLTALEQLHAAGLLDQAVDADVLARLKTKLDWRGFVTADLKLIDLPNNYFGVAFSIAQGRHRLVWEDDAAAKALLKRMLDHYRTYSDFGFADELEGGGRFDRYSVLLMGEIAQRHIEAGLEPSPEVLKWLRASAELLLVRLNAQGDGFEYGRSIGVYGETAFVEVLSAAAFYNVLTPAETDAAYSFSAVVAQRYMDVWVDGATGSINMWDKGRRTDTYRGKHRILGENLSIGRQLLYTSALWERIGYGGKTPMTDLTRWRQTQPTLTTTWFAKGQKGRGPYDRALITRRDGDRVFGLPLINGGFSQHMNTPYFPLPFAPGIIEGAADATFPQLIARFTLDDGTVLQPLAWYKDITVTPGQTPQVRYRQDEMDRMGQPAPQADARMQAETTYRFATGRIIRRDRFTPAAPLDIRALNIEFAAFSDQARLHREGKGWRVTYGSGAVKSIALRGFDHCEVAPVDDPVYRAPTQGFKTRLRCSRAAFRMAAATDVEWSIDYK
ncbi:hypothetical protein [Asticcacaulis sp. AND118]|uniref:hypothetical protein n=1 Tax=Asticcacaulis sp. AND118 TaxID=2840468 RepID=UPI001CFFC32C|nr:hypothetical protein [Asticcacaulis sp. AND118]UDF05697.1 hypothetical protein LH365_18255 [Asticcacaulis sp. AND118]